MKRLLADGSGDIFYLGHVWRHEEAGRRHSPEFLMAEWYRVGYSFDEMISETIEFVKLFIGNRKSTLLSYQEAFIQYAKIDPFTCSNQDVLNLCTEFDGYPIQTASRDELLNLVLGLKIEPRFPKDEITVLYQYPASMAALARRVHKSGHSVAERFEIYCEGLELANGYCELTNGTEQRERFVEDTAERARLGKALYPIDERFLASLAQGLPSCSGVAVGVDRLMMIEEKMEEIGQILPIAWTDA